MIMDKITQTEIKNYKTLYYKLIFFNLLKMIVLLKYEKLL